MKSSLDSASPFFFRVAGVGRVSALLLLSLVLFLPLRAEAGLPRSAISIPKDQNLAAGLKAAEQCEFPGKIIVLPPLPFDFSDHNGPAGVFAEQAQAVQSVPEGSEVWLHVWVGIGLLDGNPSEKEITERVDAFVKQMPLTAPAVRGLIVEMNEPRRSPDLFAFALVRLALSAKAGNAGLRLAFVFQPGFVGRHGAFVKRLATYADLLGTTYSESWRQDAAWIAEQALNKPLILKLVGGTSATTSQTLAATLAASGTSVEIVWSEPADAKAVAAVCAVNTFMAHSVTANMFPADSATSPFSVAVDGVGNGEHHWFGGGQSDLVIVARVNGSANSPKTVRLQSAHSGPFEI